MRKAGKRITHSFFVQPVTRGSGKFPAYSERQVSRLIHLHLCRLPALPVAYWHKLRNYGDEFAQDFHLFPFSPKPTEVALTPSVSYSIRHILPQYRAFCNKKEPGTLVSLALHRCLARIACLAPNYSYLITFIQPSGASISHL